MMSLSTRTSLAGIFTAALAARLLFWGFVARRLLGAQMYFNNDSFSYTGFINLWQTGVYTFDPTHPDAPFGRVPVYPFFWGIHWLIFGEGAQYAVAASQCVLDSVTAVLIALLAVQVTQRKFPSMLAGLAYAGYPFAVLWVTVTGTEVLTTLLGALILLLITRFEKPRDLIIIGALVGLATLTREYLGVLGIIAALYAARKSASIAIAAKRGALLLIGFVMVFAWWPIRNATHDRLILLRAETSGYHRYAPEVVAARTWINTWSIAPDAPLDWLAGRTEDYEFPDKAFTAPEQRELVKRLREKTTTCSSGFHFWRYNEVPPSGQEWCEEELVAGFNELTAAQRRARPLAYFVDVPGRNLTKGIFKNDLVSGAGTAIRLGLLSRTLLLLLGFAGAFVMRRRLESTAVFATFALHYLVISGFLRFVEMRYLLWVDALMLIPAAFFVVWALERARDWRRKSPAESAS